MSSAALPRRLPTSPARCCCSVVVLDNLSRPTETTETINSTNWYGPMISTGSTAGLRLGVATLRLGAPAATSCSAAMRLYRVSMAGVNLKATSASRSLDLNTAGSAIS